MLKWKNSTGKEGKWVRKQERARSKVVKEKEIWEGADKERIEL